MSQEGEVGHGVFLWDPQQWGFSNSDNSGGNHRGSGKKPPESSSNSPMDPTVPPVRGKRMSNRASKTSSPKIDGGSGGPSETKAGGAESDHEIHIWTERERRKKMRNMFSSLHALLPQLPPKADKSTIVDEAVNYIKALQQTLQKLEKKKLERVQGEETPTTSVAVVQAPGAESREAFMADQGKNWSAANSPTSSMSIPQLVPHGFQTWSSPNVVLSVTGEDAHISICTAKKPCLLSTIFYVMEKHKLEVLSAHISSDHFRSMYMIHAHATGVSDQFPEASMIEEIYKLAVGELLLWLSS